jgi:predicted Holliday junction resolvase-like endonuclease
VRLAALLPGTVSGGAFSEQVAPFLPDFPKDLKTSEARFIGKPIDFLIFKGMDDQHINEVVFVEIKSGMSQLSNNERTLSDDDADQRQTCIDLQSGKLCRDTARQKDLVEDLAFAGTKCPCQLDLVRVDPLVTL